ncbi:class I SAM-dependent methyltransferase [Halomicrobium urmianum]|uniref:class I SAM-dependent methyltransferase n=1 Tax=Halomicrobium urmianum TaxID=1586233 RepID=UPI001CD95DC3|nr:class I SAM-dependent methyltransferase [Halomicrobium urmianum]
MDQRSVVREGYDDIAETYDEQRRAEGPERDLAEAFAADLSDGNRVLDAGCGAGRPVLETLASEHDVVGLDISTGQLRIARERAPGGCFAQGDLANLPFQNGTFDGVASFHAVIHVPKDEHADALSEFHRVLRPGGDLLVVMGDDAWEGRNEDWLDAGAAMEWGFFGRDRNRDLLADAGFEVVDERVLDDELGGQFAFFRARA